MEYRAVVTDLPTTVKAFTMENEDGTYVICVNAKLTREQQMLSYRHELSHIINNDFESEENADDLESLRHKEVT